jgi:acyl-CoA reductase-like NAD-dependent aldehyde dehydrogenase
MIRIPILRAGRPYYSLATRKIGHFSSGEAIAEVSQANLGLIARDMAEAEDRRKVLSRIPIARLIETCERAAALFRDSELPVGDVSQTPRSYIRQLSATTGMPESLCRSNMEKICLVLENMEAVLGGLSRGLDLSILDSGFGVDHGSQISFLRETAALGAILPSNSPGVHSLWVPSVALKVPLVLKPGGQEPWTPLRIAQAFIEAGCPGEAFSYYPTDYSGATEILMRCGRSMLFGDASTVGPWKGDPRIQIHGPGWSKVILAEDQMSHWQDYLDLMVESVLANGGRSCINASSVWVPSHGREVAEALAERLAEVKARSLDDPEAEIAAFASPAYARRLSQLLDSQLKKPGAVDLTRQIRGERLVEQQEAWFVLPTVVYCDDLEHPLSHVEYLFPYVSVVEVPQEEILEKIPATLVATLITEDQEFIDQAMACPRLERLNLGPIPTPRISWDQPHEGNLFELLYRRRALQMA